MRIRTFFAETMEDAMDQVREAMGPDAIIISSHESPRGRGAEIRAAIEESNLNTGTDTAGSPPGLAIDDVLEDRLRQELFGEMQSAISIHKETTANKSKERVKKTRLIPPKKSIEKRPDGWVKTGIAGLVKGIQSTGDDDFDETADQLTNDGDFDTDIWSEQELKQSLTYHNVPERLQEDLIRTAQATDAEETAIALGAAFDMRLTFDPVPASPARPIILIGAPGVGKTVTTAKLATQSVLAGFAPKIVTTDTLRAGAVAQLQSFMDILKCNLSTADSPETLRQFIVENNEHPIFIDTPATNPFSRSELRDVTEFIDAAGAEPVWVVAADANPHDLVDMAEIFSKLHIKRLIATRIDTTRRLGGIVAAAEKTNMAFAQVSITPYVAQGLSTLNPLSLARLITKTQGKPNNDDSKPVGRGLPSKQNKSLRKARQ